jgi:hypothetical protein
LDKAQSVTVNITGLTFTNATKEIRIINASCGNTTGAELEFDIIEDSGNIGDGSEWVRLLFPYTFNNTVAVIYDYGSAAENTTLRLEDDDVWAIYYNATVPAPQANYPWSVEECGDSLNVTQSIDGQIRWNLTTGATLCSYKRTGLTIAQATGFTFEVGFKIPSAVVPTQATKAQGYLIMVDGTSETQSSFNRTHLWRGTTYLSIPNTDNYHTIRFKAIGSANADVWIDGLYKGVIVGGAYAQKYFAILTYDDYQIIYYDYATYSNNSGAYLYPEISIGTEQGTGTTPQWSANITTPSSPATYAPDAAYKFNITCTDATGMKNAWMVFNSTTYTMTNTTSKYNYTFRDLKAGEYTYTFTCNSTAGNTNTTSSLRYIISKNTTSLNLTINGTNGNVNYTYPAYSNATAWNNITGSTGVTLYRNNTAKSNPEVARLGAGYWNYTAVYDHENYTASSIERFITTSAANSNLLLTASPGWTNQENTLVTITCAADVGITLTRDNINISSPYAATLTFGNYNFTCVVNDIQNYTPPSSIQTLVISSGGFGCTDPNTYAFEKTLTVTPASYTGFSINLNFTDFVLTNYTREDLRDVKITSSAVSVKRNLTNGYYLVVNVSGSTSLTVQFGNYIGNNTYADTARSDNTTTITAYSEINDYYIISLYNEVTGVYILPPQANTTSTIYCSEGSSTFSVNHTKILVATFAQISDTKVTVTYSSTEIYFRNLINRGGVEYKTFYLADANTHQVVQMLFKLEDNTGDFAGSTFKIKKWMEGTEQIITELPFDAENKVIVYLINGDKYQVYVDNGDEERSIGYLYVDTSDLEKTIVLGEVISTDMQTGNLTIYLNLTDAGVIVFNYYDPTNQTNLIEFWVYVYANQSQLYYASSTNHSSVSFNYVVPNASATYTVRYRIEHDIFGSQTIEKYINLVGSYIVPAIWPLALLITALGGSAPFWITMFCILPIPMFFDSKYAGLASIMLCCVAAMFVYWKMYALSGTLLIVALVIAVFIEVGRKRS